MIRKIGLDPTDPKERNKAFQIFLSSGMLNEETYSTWSQICLMSKSLSVGEYAACLAKDPWTKEIKNWQ